MADSKLKLPGDFQAGKNYLLKGETLLAWQKALLADRAIPGPGLTESQGPDGRTFTAAGGGQIAAAAGGAFYDTFAAAENFYLLTGMVAGGTGSVAVPQDDLLLCAIGSEPTDGTETWLKIQGTAPLTDDVLTTAFNITSVTVLSYGGSNVIPEYDSPAGTFYHLLGTWFDSIFRPTGSGGNLTLGFCPLAGFRLD